MSLTNPKTVVTEERLSEFYQQILPYLGGMPEMLANKFSKSDLYSTDEKMIGQWIDGKPLYQKVFTVDHTAISNNTTCTIVDLSTLSIDKLIRFVPLARWAYEPYSQAGGGTISTGYWHDTGDNTIKIKTSAVAWFGTDFYMLVQYTKTTDSPVAIGIDTDYSTEEKIVGTWIDGKPIYQKTWTGSATISSTSWNTDFQIPKAGMAQIVGAFGTGTPLSGGQYWNLIAVLDVHNTYVGFLASRDNSSCDVRTITLRYTKTTG